MGTFYNPVEVHFGIDKLSELGEITQSIQPETKRILFLNRGGNFHDSADKKIILEQLKNKELIIHDFEISNPDIQDLFHLLEATEDQDYDLILVVGGGSILDVAKSMAALKGMDIQSAEELRSIINHKGYVSNKNKCKWIAVPTTAGTGSEVTPWATIWDSENNVKLSVDAKDLFAAAAIIDPNLTVNLPLRITVSSALDAICHATEAYWSKKTNEISRTYALSAIENITKHIHDLVDDLSNIELRYKIAMGSLLAGLAFSNTRTTACHSISYPITLMFGVDHGIAVSVTLSQILKINEDSLIEKDKLFKAFGVNSSEEVDDVIKAIYQKANLSPQLRDYDINKSELSDIVDNAYLKGRMDNNAVDIPKDQLLQVLHHVY